jgi:hypothetical protein
LPQGFLRDPLQGFVSEHRWGKPSVATVVATQEADADQ